MQCRLALIQSAAVDSSNTLVKRIFKGLLKAHEARDQLAPHAF